MAVNVIDTLKPKNDGSFPIVEAVDVAVSSSQRLPAALAGKVNQSDFETLSDTVLSKANASDVTIAIANLQGQIDQIIISASAESIIAPEVVAARVNIYGVPHTTLNERIDDDEFEIEKISKSMPNTLAIYQKTIDNSGVISDNDTRTLSAITYIGSGQALTLEEGYSFRYANYQRTGNSYSFVEMDSTWRNTLEFSNAGYRRIVFRKNDDSDITPNDTIGIIKTSSTIRIPSDITLLNKLSNIESDIMDVKNQIPINILIEQKTLSTTGVITDNNTRTLSAVSQVNSGNTLIMRSGYSFRYAIYSDYTDEGFVEMDSEWRTSLTFNTVGLKRFVFKKNDGSNITPDETINAIDPSSTLQLTEGYVLKSTLDKYGAAISELQEEVDPLIVNNMNLTVQLTGKDNMMWSYALSLYPLCQAFNRVRNCIYWGYTTSEGYSGIACYNLDDKTLKKTHLKKSDIDDHNPCAIYVRDNGEIIVSYSGGHNTDKYIHVRKSKTPECIDFFDDDRNINVDYYSTYSQIFEYDNKLWIFFRFDNTSWGCITSTDGGETWSPRKAIIFAPVQYYCKFQKTTTDGLLRMCMYSNPDQTEKDIRMGFIDLSSGKVYNADNATELGTVGTVVRWENFSVEIPAPLTGKQRLFDVAVTPPSYTSILIARWTTSTDGVYKWYNNGTLTDICNCGTALYLDKYQGGVAFVTTSQIVVSRGANGIEYIELWDLSSTPELYQEIYHEEKGTIPIRNCRPIVSPDGKAIIWHRGYFNDSDYTDFNAEAKIYIIDSNTII